jgi:hypothetical protein
MATAARLIAAAVLAAVVGWAAPVLAVQPPAAPGPVDHAFQRLYNFDFPGSLAILDAAATTDPANPLIASVRAATYLFMELDRMRILDTQFFMNDDNMVDGSSRGVPDPAVRVRLFAAIDHAKKLAQAKLAANPNDVDGLFALCMSSGTETDYTALVERRTWRSTKLAPVGLVPARKLLAQTPPFYDAYLQFGALEYIVGNLPFFVRWFIHYDGIAGDKRRGIDQLKLVVRHGRYYGPFARILLAVVSLREQKFADAEALMRGLSDEFPENALFKREAAKAAERARRAKR